MEEWELEFEWLRTRHVVKDAMKSDKLPDLKGILFLIGVQELGAIRTEFTKEEKRDLMHVAVCTLLEEEGYYEFIGRDHDGWPHFKNIKKLKDKKLEDQELLLKKKVIAYFLN